MDDSYPPDSHISQDGYRDGDGMVIRLIRWKGRQGQYLLSLDIEPQPDGKGSRFAQDVWIWLEEREVAFRRNTTWDFYTWVDEDLAFEFRMRWL